MATTKTTTKTTKAAKPTTSLVSPADIEQMKSQQHDLVVKAEKFKLTKPTEETEAYAVLGQLKSRITLVEKKRTEITQPLNASLRQINALFKALSEPLGEADRVLRSKIGLGLLLPPEDADFAAEYPVGLTERLAERFEQGVDLPQGSIERLGNLRALLLDEGDARFELPQHRIRLGLLGRLRQLELLCLDY